MTAININQIEDEFSKKFSLLKYVEFSEKINSNDLINKSYAEKNVCYINFSKPLEAQNLVALCLEKKIQNLIQTQSDYFLENLNFASNLIQDPQQFYFSSAIPNLENKLDSISIDFSEPTERQYVFEKIDHFLQSFIKNQTTRDSLRSIADELYMNAIYDAPQKNLSQKINLNTADKDPSLDKDSCEKSFINHFQNQNHNHIPRSNITIQRSLKNTSITCTDYYGSLNIESFLKRLHFVYSVGAGEAMSLDKRNGAGLGCLITLEHSDFLVLGVLENKMTRVTCFVPDNLSNKKRKNFYKSLQFITL